MEEIVLIVDDQLMAVVVKQAEPCFHIGKPYAGAVVFTRNLWLVLVDHFKEKRIILYG